MIFLALSLSLRGVSFDAGDWQEIDTLDDLRAAERAFAPVAQLAPHAAIAMS